MTLVLSPLNLQLGQVSELNRVGQGASLVQAVDSTALPVSVNSSQVANLSTVPGATVTAALDALQATQGLPLVVSDVGEALAAPFTMVALAAGHPPGMYLCCLCVIVRTPVAVGAFARNIRYSAPIIGSVTSHASVSGPLNVAGLLQDGGDQFLIPFRAISTGLAPIEYLMTPVGVVGVPSLDIYVSATLVARS